MAGQRESAGPAKRNRRGRNLVRALVAGFVVVTGLVGIPGATEVAEAANGCGSGWHKESDGGLFGQGSRTVAGRRAIAKAGGYVRYCTRERNLLDQVNQRVIVGLPHDWYGSGRFSGTRITRVCLKLQVTVRGASIPNGTSIGISGLTPGFSQSFGDSSSTVSRQVCGAPTTLIQILPSDLTFTAPNAGWSANPNDPRITSVQIESWATVRFRTASGTISQFEARSSDTDVPTRRVYAGQDRTAPVLRAPTASLASPFSRTVRYSIFATDDSGTVAGMRVRVSGENWRSWVPVNPTGTVILPDSYGTFTVWFQVRDAAGNLSAARAAPNVTRRRDTVAPTLAAPSASLTAPGSRTVAYSLSASDNAGPVARMRVRVSGEDWRSWVPYSPTGTVILPDRYGLFTVWFQVQDASGNSSAERAAPNVTRTAQPSLSLRQIDNSGNLRSCGSSAAAPCSDVVKRFRTTISSPVLPPTDLLLKAWRNVNGTWIETSTSPFMRAAISGSVVDIQVTANLLAGVWRFQSQVPNAPNGTTAFAASDFQYLLID